jgi:hypothetical protein
MSNLDVVGLNLVNKTADLVGNFGRTGIVTLNIDAVERARLNCEFVNLRLEEFIRWCWNTEGTGYLHNLGPFGEIQTGRHVPWGASRKGGMTRTQSDLVRFWLRWLDNKGLKPLWIYDQSTRRWWCSLGTYPNLESALAWFEVNKLTPTKWLKLERGWAKHKAK